MLSIEANEHITFGLRYQDEHLIGLNKQKGIIVHPSRGTQRGTLANALAFYATSLSRGDDPFRPGIVHRLDKNTTGVMLVAKTDEAHWRRLVNAPTSEACALN